MFKAKILTGCWDEKTLEVWGMPKDFILSARSLHILEVEEYDSLKAKAELLDEAISTLRDFTTALITNSGIPSTVKVGGYDGIARHSRLMLSLNKSKTTLSKAKELDK